MQSTHHHHLLCMTPALEFPVCRLRMLDRPEYVRCCTLHLVIVLVLVLIQWMGMDTVMHMVMATAMAMVMAITITMAVAMVDLIIMLGMLGSDFFASSVRSLSSHIIIFCNAIHPCTFTSVLWYMIMNDCYRFRTNFYIYARLHSDITYIYYTIYHWW